MQCYLKVALKLSYLIMNNNILKATTPSILIIYSSRDTKYFVSKFSNLYGSRDRKSFVYKLYLRLHKIKLIP